MGAGKLGLALAGGGGKGAYQVGVWSALREFRLDAEVRAIAGTSVGGLNGALFAQGDYDKAEAMWLNIESRNMLTVNDYPEVSVRLTQLAAAGFISERLYGMILKSGLFKRDGLQGMLDEGLDAGRLATSATPLTVTLHHHERNEVVYLPVTSARTANDALLATAALPLIFGEVELDGVAYTDGGFYWGLPHKRLDNTPILPLVEAGCTTIIVVCLSRDDAAIVPRKYPGVRILPIVPRETLGAALAPLDFSNAGAERRMAQGYEDARRIFNHLEQFVDSEERYQALWQEVQAGAEGEARAYGAATAEAKHHAGTLREVEDFDRIVAEDDFRGSLEAGLQDAPPAALDALALENSALLSDLDRRQIEMKVSEFLARNGNSRRAVEAAVLDALAALSPVDGQASHLKEQGVLARLWGAISGQSQRLAAESDLGLARAQFAALRLVNAVSEKGLLTLEFTCALQNRINGVVHDLTRLADRQHRDFRRVYSSLAGLYSKLRNSLIDHEQRLTAVERRVRLLDWLSHANARLYEGVPLDRLPIPLRLSCLANEFFHNTQGAWMGEELLSLRVMCDKAGLPDSEPIGLGTFLQVLAADPVCASTLTRGLVRPAAGDGLLPSASQWLIECRDRVLARDEPLATSLSRWGFAADTALPAWDLLLDLLFHLRAAGFVALVESDLERLKQHWVDRLNGLLGLVHEGVLPGVFARDVEGLKRAIEGFRLAVPLVGKTSVGKSTLVNAWIGEELQPQELLPCTDVATEFHYAPAGREKVVVHWPATTSDESPPQELPLAGYREFLARLSTQSRQPLFLEVHCNRPTLGMVPDLVVVDTPGLGSANGRHEAALGSYIGDGVAFILCVDRGSQVGEYELEFVNRQRSLGQQFAVLVCQQDLVNRSQRLAQQSSLAQQVGLASDQMIRGCSARDGDLSGFEDILAHFEQSKGLLFERRFAPALASLVEQAETLLEQRLTADRSVAELENRKGVISQRIEMLQLSSREEEAALLRDTAGPVSQRVLNDVGNFLRGRQPVYAKMLIDGQNIGHLLSADARNASQLAAQHHLRPRLASAAEKLGQVADAKPGDMPEVAAREVRAAQTSALGKAVASGLLGAWAGGLVGGVIAAVSAVVLSGARAREQADARARGAIEDVLIDLQRTLPSLLERQATEHFMALKSAIEQQLQSERQNIQQIELQLTASAEQRQALRARAERALAALRGRPADLHTLAAEPA